jgi:adenylate cyclase, class 2
MAVILEREIKLRFPDVQTAHAAVQATGATPLRCRRLQEDCLLDTADERLRARRCVLRVRIESGKSYLTFKGPVEPSIMKVREELETLVADGAVLLRILQELGFRAWFRYEKFREEFAIDDVIVAVDETPVGTFVELEGGARGIEEMALKLGRRPADYLLDSYRRLYAFDCEARGLVPGDMLFKDLRT